MDNDFFNSIDPTRTPSVHRSSQENGRLTAAEPFRRWPQTSHNVNHSAQITHFLSKPGILRFHWNKQVGVLVHRQRSAILKRKHLSLFDELAIRGLLCIFEIFEILRHNAIYIYNLKRPNACSSAPAIIPNNNKRETAVL